MQQNKDMKPPAAESSQAAMSVSEWFAYVFVPKHGKTALTVLVVALLLLAGMVYYNRTREGAEVIANRALGPVYVYLEEGRLDSAESFLASFVEQEQPDLVKAKAYLFLGEVYYHQGRFSEAVEAYSRVNLPHEDYSLITSGALHGLAASHIQMGQYHEAIENLERFVELYMGRTGSQADRSAGQEPADLSPAVPNALWKLVLAYRQTGQMEKMKEAAERLVKVYPDSREAYEATRLLARLPAA